MIGAGVSITQEAVRARVGAASPPAYKFMSAPIKVARLGNSLEQYAEAGGTTAGARPVMRTNFRDPNTWLRALERRTQCINYRSSDSRQSRYFSGGNQGLSGDSITPQGANPGLTTRVVDVTAFPHDVLIVNEGINYVQLTTATAEATAIANGVAGLRNILDQVRATPGFENTLVIFKNTPGCLASSGANTSTIRHRIVLLNAALLADMVNWPGYATNNTGIVRHLDAFSLIMDGHAASEFDAGTYFPAAKYFYDTGVHTGTVASYLFAKAEKAIIAEYMDPAIANPFNARFSTGNLNPNPTHTGTSGGKAGGTTGTVPTAMTITGPGSSTAVAASIVGGEVVIDYNIASSVATSETIVITWNTVSGSGNSFGGTTDWVAAEAECYDSGSGIMTGSELRLVTAPSSIQWSNAGVTDTTATPNLQQFPAEAITYNLETQPVQLDGTTTSLQMSLRLNFNPSQRTGAGQFKMKRMWAGQVSDPTADWS